MASLARSFAARLRPCAVVLCIAAPTAIAADARTDPAMEARIRAHVEFLADDLLEGRAAGSKGYDVAARYVAAQYAQVGLEPGGTQGTWYQPIRFLEASPVIPAARLVLERDGGTVEMEAARDFLPGIDWSAPRSEVTAPLAFVGFGVHAPERGYDDFAGVDLRGKVAVVLSSAPPTFPSTERAHYSTGLTKNAELVRRGAVGVITVRTPWDERLRPWERVVQSSWYPGMRWLDAQDRPANAFPELKRTAILGPSGAARLFEGAPESLESVYARAKDGRPGAFDLPGRVTLAGQTLHAKRESSNVVGLLRGSDPTLASEYVVLTAHLDGLGRGAAIGGDAIYNGAMDNATGIAVMLEIARALRVADARPGRTLVFLAVTAEERGLLGSDYYAEHPTVPRAGIVANLNMDMPIAIVPAADFVAYGAEHSTLGPVAARAAQAEGFVLTPDPRPDEVFFVRSDQYSFVRRGVPALYLDNGERSVDPDADVTALHDDFLSNRYHMPGDDLSQPIDWWTLAALTRVNLRVVHEIGNARERPQWNEGDFFGRTYGSATAAR